MRVDITSLYDRIRITYSDGNYVKTAYIGHNNILGLAEELEWLGYEVDRTQE
jgi:hypothetical protein